MRYQAVLKADTAEISAYGDTDAQAVDRALADSISVRSANPAHVALSVWYDHGAGSRTLAYCCRLSKYKSDTEGF